MNYISKKKILKLLASLKLAVVILFSLSFLIAIGTIIESKLDAQAAAKLVYKTKWMYLVLGLLIVNLTAVMIDRWPWQKKHAPFVLAHIGIIILLFGSWLTSEWGLDGTMKVDIGSKNRFVNLPNTDLLLYASFDGQSYTKLFEKEVDFFLHSPKQTPLSIPVESGEIKVIDYQPYTIAERKVKKSESPRVGSAIRFQLINPNVQFSDWIVQKGLGLEESKNLGPAEVHLGAIPTSSTFKNEIYIEPVDDTILNYAVFYKDVNRKTLKGKIVEGGRIQTGWVGLEFKLLRYYPKAEHVWEFEEQPAPTQITTSAIQVEFQGQKYWVQAEDVLKLFTDKSVYILSYGSKRIDIGFDLFLKKFEVGRYQGTMRASSYQSRVEVPNLPDQLISMNEPLKYNGLTFYQASFQSQPDGTPTASVFSVNHDPGRWVKYLGSFLIVLGSILLFYNKRKSARALAPKNVEDVIK